MCQRVTEAPSAPFQIFWAEPHDLCESTRYIRADHRQLRPGEPKIRAGPASELLAPLLEKIRGYIAGQVTVAAIGGVLAGLSSP